MNFRNAENSVEPDQMADLDRQCFQKIINLGSALLVGIIK